VYDAPIKKRSELERILLLGVHVNVDNFQELEVITELLQNKPSSSSIGLRVNPQIGAGSVAMSSTSFRNRLPVNTSSRQSAKDKPFTTS
jgi:diaminopimelate decarboxylase